MTATVRELLAEATLTPGLVDRFLDPSAHNWATFDPELGYLPQTSTLRVGMDGSFTAEHYAPSGERRMIAYAHRPCRINTYGDSFTQCAQVSDGETWQEILAAHLGEPIRNFGVGGYGVYQAYRRLLREEATGQSCRHVVLNVWSDDHVRSIYAWRWIFIRGYRLNLVAHPPEPGEASMFHCNPWAHVAMDLEYARFEERGNPYPTPASLYRLCDPEHVYEAFHGDPVVQAFAAMEGAADVDLALLRRAADALGLTLDLDTLDAAAGAAPDLVTQMGMAASKFIIDKLLDFVQASGKRLLVLLSYSSDDVIRAIGGARRFDQPFVDALSRAGVCFVDTLAAHVADYASFRCTPEEYVSRYYIGHYNPHGNHFFAYAVKDEFVDWLAPRPPAYSPRSTGPEHFGC